MNYLSNYKFNILKICFYGLINGMGLLIGTNTLNFWLSSFSVDLKIIGFFALTSLPYAFKYFIAIFIEEVKFKFLNTKFGKYKTWFVVTQVILVFCLILISDLNPQKDLIKIAILGLVLSLSSVIQYIILNGDRIQILNEDDQGKGSSIYNIGYRLGMFFTGAGVIYLSVYFVWKEIFFTLALLYSVLSIIVFYFFREPDLLEKNTWFDKDKNAIYRLITIPIEHFKGYRNFIIIICFILLYQASDAMLMTMLNPFLLENNYTAEEIASASKLCGIVLVIIGGLLGGIVVDKIKIKQSLLYFGMLHTLGYLMFIILANSNKNILALYFITGYVAFTGGLATTAYFAFISGLSKGSHTTILYAFLSSIVGVIWVIFPVISGIIAEKLGWEAFFSVISILGLITILLISFIPKQIYKMYKED